MRVVVKDGKWLAALIVAILFVAGCTPLIGAYSPTAYENATSLKPETLALMDKAKEAYSDHKTDVENLDVELNKAYEYVRGLPRNSISAKQWDILISKDGDILGKFFSRWEKDGQLSKIYIQEFKSIVSDAFDEIICLEANKEKATGCSDGEGE